MVQKRDIAGAIGEERGWELCLRERERERERERGLAQLFANEE